MTAKIRWVDAEMRKIKKMENKEDIWKGFGHKIATMELMEKDKYEDVDGGLNDIVSIFWESWGNDGRQYEGSRDWNVKVFRLLIF